MEIADEIGDPMIGDLEKDYIIGMASQARTMYENIDEFFDDLVKDQAAMSLLQAGMSPFMDKKYGE